MNVKILFYGAAFLCFMALATFFAEQTFAGARPYAAGSFVLMAIAFATTRNGE